MTRPVYKKISIVLQIAIVLVCVACFSDSTGTKKSPDIITADDNYDSSADMNPSATLWDDFDGDTINETVWQIAGWREHNGQTGRERCYAENGYLNLVLINDSKSGILSSAIQTRAEFGFGKWEARLKTSKVPGVLNAMYTIDWDDTASSSPSDDGSKQEIDIEFLTYVKNRVHFAVHEAGKTSFDTNPDILLNELVPSEGFHIWAFNITPQYIEWSVDGNVLLKYNYSEHDVAITKAYQLKFNSWTGVNWVNGPPEKDLMSIFMIDWIQFTPYSEGK